MDEVEMIRMRQLRRQDNPDLPESVTKLVTPAGAQVYLVGTAYFSEKSQDEVSQVIHAVQPDIVVLELCKNRESILSLDDETSRQEAQNIDAAKFRRSVQQNGVIGAVMKVLLLYVTARLSKEVGIAPGAIFRRAFNEARIIPGCKVHLGDRPIQITLKRAMSALSVWEKLKLAWYLTKSEDPTTAEDVEKFKQKDFLEEWLEVLNREFPGLSTVCMNETDVYLALSLKGCSKPVPIPGSLTGYYLPVVVGVVGLSHVSGIVENWTRRITREELTAIVSIPPPTTSYRVIKLGIKGSMFGVFLWGCFRIYKWSGFGS